MSTIAPPRPKPGTSRLSEVARHLVAPTGIAKTYWNAVRGQCSDLGLSFDQWQDGAGRLILAQRSNGRFAAGIGGVHLSWPRQVGKTYLIGAIVIALCLLKPGMLALWTAHHGKTINETFRAMQAMAKRSKIAPHVLRITTGNGDEGIEFRNGSRLLFGAREHGFGLGFSKVSLIVFDEAQRLKSRTIVDMVPTTNAAANPLVFYIGTPPRPEDPGEVFTSRRKKALAVEAARAAGEDPRYNALYIELGADPNTPRDLAEIDWDQLAKANPSYPHRVDRESIERMWEQFEDKDDFWREGYGIWDDQGVRLWSVISKQRWAGLAIPAAEAPKTGPMAFAVRFSADGERVGAAAARLAEDGRVHVEALGVSPLSDGTAALVEWLVERWRKASLILVDGKAGAGDLVAELVAAGVSKRRVREATTPDVFAANAGFLRSIAEGGLTHCAQPGLDASVRAAGKKTYPQSGGWVWQAVTPDGDVTALHAVTLARHAVTTGRRKQPSGEGRSSGNRTMSTGRRAVVT
jgi:hypothetical protein